ncbi:unnamed protein product [Sphagnum balticum]
MRKVIRSIDIDGRLPGLLDSLKDRAAAARVELYPSARVLEVRIQPTVLLKQSSQLGFLVLQPSLSQLQLILQRSLQVRKGSFKLSQSKAVGRFNSVDFCAMGFRQLAKFCCELGLEFF